MALYYRIQPKGLDIKCHYSELSDSWETGELADGLHVFERPSETFHAIWYNGMREAYGDEIIVIEAEENWDNGDVEGVCIDPESAKVVARYSWNQWVSLWKEVIAKEFPDVLDEDLYNDFQELQEYEPEEWDEEVASKWAEEYGSK